MGFSRQGYWNGLLCPPPGDLPNPGIKPMSPASPALQEGSLPLSHWGSPGHVHTAIFKMNNKDLLWSTWNSAQCFVATWMGGGLGENGYMYMYGWVPSLFTWNHHNIVNQLYPSIKCFLCLKKSKNKIRINYKVLTHATKWMDLENMLNERIQSWKTMCCRIPCTLNEQANPWKQKAD